jgi:hypothetical protein
MMAYRHRASAVRCVVTSVGGPIEIGTGDDSTEVGDGFHVMKSANRIRRDNRRELGAPTVEQAAERQNPRRGGRPSEREFRWHRCGARATVQGRALARLREGCWGLHGTRSILSPPRAADRDTAVKNDKAELQATTNK